VNVKGFTCVLLLLWLPQAAGAQSFKVYPGARADNKIIQGARKEPSVQGYDLKVYFTPDSFEKVRAFYSSLYHQMPAPHAPKEAPKLRWAFFAIDGAAKLYESKYWIKVQRPYFASRVDKHMPDYHSARDETVIEVVQKK